MKKFAIIFIIVAATTMIFSACGKYEEGPAFSLLTKKARIVGTWTYSEVTVNGVVQDMQGFVMKSTLEKDGTGTMSMIVSGITLTSDLKWEFDDTKENIRTQVKEFNETEYSDWEEAEIIRLTNSECWLRTIDTVLNVEQITISKLVKD